MKNNYLSNGTGNFRLVLDNKDIANIAKANAEANNAYVSTDEKKIVHRKKRQVNPFYSVIRKFKQIFAAYDESEQNTKTKRQCLNLAARMRPDLYPDTLRFWMDLRTEARLLTDSLRFRRDCCDLCLNFQSVAEHLVCEGKATVNKVLKVGLLDGVGDRVMMFADPLYVDNNQLFGKLKDDVEQYVESEDISVSEIEKEVPHE
jgi:hypothetical protein